MRLLVTGATGLVGRRGWPGPSVVQLVGRRSPDRGERARDELGFTAGVGLLESVRGPRAAGELLGAAR